MTQQGRIVAFLIDQPFDSALRMLRKAFMNERLRIAYELDTAARVKQELGVGLKPNIVLYLDDPIQLLEATVMNPSGGLFIPEPVVLSASAASSRVSVRAIESVSLSELPASLRAAVTNVHERILSGIQRVGYKETATGQMAVRDKVPA